MAAGVASGPDDSDLSDLVEMALRIICADVYYELDRAPPPPTLEDMQVFRVHVTRLRLMGHLREELSLKLLLRCDEREALLQASQIGVKTARP